MYENDEHKIVCWRCEGDGIEERSALILFFMFMEFPRKDGLCRGCNGKGYKVWWPDEYPREAS